MMREVGNTTTAWPVAAVAGETPEIGHVLRIIQMAAKTNHPVLIVGEPGTGKEVIARAIHAASSQRRLPFRARNCENIRAIDLERELLSDHRGSAVVFQNICGTLFLNNVAYLTLELQGLLLHALQRTESVDSSTHCLDHPRIIAATTRDLNLEVRKGIFRRDLYYRLSAIGLRVPPLRERRHDIPQLAAALLRELATISGKQFRLSDSATQAILSYHWPGNVRELENCLERACCSSTGPLIKLFDLPLEVSGIKGNADIDIHDAKVVPLSELEQRSIEKTLKLVEGNKVEAARLLGIGKTTLYRRLKEYESQRRTS